MNSNLPQVIKDILGKQITPGMRSRMAKIALEKKDLEARLLIS